MKKHIKSFILIFCLVTSFEASAFINVETLRHEPGEGFKGKSSLSFEGQSGNTDKNSVTVSSLNIKRESRDEYLFLADYADATTNGNRDTHNGRLHLRDTLLFREIYSYELYLQDEFDDFKELNSRAMAGVNLRIRLSQTESEFLFAGLGAFYEWEDYKVIDDRAQMRGNPYVSYMNRFSDRVSGSTTIYYQPSFKGSDDYRTRFQAGLETTMTEQLSVALQYEVSHDNWVPRENIEKTDTHSLVGITYKY